METISSWADKVTGCVGLGVLNKHQQKKVLTPTLHMAVHLFSKHASRVSGNGFICLAFWKVIFPFSRQFSCEILDDQLKPKMPEWGKPRAAPGLELTWGLRELKCSHWDPDFEQAAAPSKSNVKPLCLIIHYYSLLHSISFKTQTS